MTILTEWSDAPFAPSPIATATGPFPHRPFLETWWKHESGGDQLALVSEESSTLPLRWSPSEYRLLFCGDADLTDYHTPLGEAAPAIEVLANHFDGAGFSFDSLPEAAATSLGAALEAGGYEHRTTDDAVTAVVDVPADTGAWLQGLAKKERHEVRRKLRRFEELLGEARLERRSDPAALGGFAEMHRSAAGAKGGFMTPEREAFFSDLVDHAGAVIDLLVTEQGPVAAGFGFPRPDGYYLYNSAYAPEAEAASPGIVLLAMLIDQLVGDGIPRLDLLKGDEPYKFRLGAVPRKLYRIEGVLG